jgi:hypothetical protein
MESAQDAGSATVAGLIALLAGFGVDVERTDVPEHSAGNGAHANLALTLTMGGVGQAIRVEVERRWSAALEVRLDHDASSGNREPWMLVLPRIDTSRRAWLRERGINYADMTGALSLRVPGIRIEVDGAAKRPWGTPIAAQRHVNPFSKKASLVLRRFFEAPHASHCVTALARDTGIAIGWAWDVTEELFQRGYIAGTGDELRLADAASAIVHWSGAYSWKKSRRRNFVVPYTQAELERRLADAWQPASMPWALTLLSGARKRIGHVMHESSTYAYALAATPAALEKSLSAVHASEVAEPVPGTHLLCVLEPWYGHAALFGAQIIDELPVVSDLQLFLDLAHYPLRGVEAAVHLLRSRIALDIGMAASDVARIERSIG